MKAGWEWIAAGHLRPWWSQCPLPPQSKMELMQQAKNNPVETTAPGPDLLGQSLADLGHPELQVRQQAVAALVRIGAPAISTLCQLLDDRGRKRAAAAEALARIGDPSTADLLTSHLSDPSDDVRRWCAYGLGKLGGAGALPSLRQRCYDPSYPVAAVAVAAIGRIGGDNAVASLRSLLQDPEAARLTREVCAAIGQAGDAACADVLAQLVTSRDRDVAESAALALSSIAERDPKPSLARVLPVLRRAHNRFFWHLTGISEIASRIRASIAWGRQLPLPVPGHPAVEENLPRAASAETAHGALGLGPFESGLLPPGWAVNPVSDDVISIGLTRRAHLFQNAAPFPLLLASLVVMCLLMRDGSAVERLAALLCLSLPIWAATWGAAWAIYGDERWLAGRSYLERRCGWRFLSARVVTTYRNATIEVSGSSGEAWRLVVKSGPCSSQVHATFNEAEVRRLGAFLAARTGWPLA